FSQSLDIIARGIGTPDDLHLGSLLALGFRQSSLDLMTQMGRNEVGRILERLAEERPGLPGGELMDHFDAATRFDRYVLVDRLDDVVVITLRRPAQMNALTDATNDEILGVVTSFEDDPTVAGFVIVGYGPRAFCAGAEIGKFTEMLGDAAASAQYSRDSSRLFVHLDSMTKPVVAAVNGMALGGGAELATRCHEMVAHSRAFFQFPEVGLGILPGIGGVVVPYRKWPASATKFTAMITRAERLSAVEALEIGMVSGIEDDYESLVRLAAERVRALVGSVPLPWPDLSSISVEGIVAGEAVSADGAVLSSEVVGIIVDAIEEGLRAPDLGAALEAGYLAFGRAAETKAAAEGIGAFLSGRKPDFTGM
ncbi:MAG TPA: enoyl-CoA hydratase/isomerase family protein, partial [Thermoleophilia bacterium]|nr:enoyl-CoA hydratase/isomerase family protein [Thermoleophilia bacterium]